MIAKVVKKIKFFIANSIVKDTSDTYFLAMKKKNKLSLQKVALAVLYYL